MKLKRIITLSLALLLALAVSAQRGPGRFDPKKFEADLEQFITTEAGLTPTEASQFFPLYREMRRKQFTYFKPGKMFRHVNMTDEKQCEEMIRDKDSREIKVKEIQQAYHNMFLRVLPASKVLRVINAEDKFHKQSFKRAVKWRNGQHRQNTNGKQ